MGIFLISKTLEALQTIWDDLLSSVILLEQGRSWLRFENDYSWDHLDKIFETWKYGNNVCHNHKYVFEKYKQNI